MNWLIFILAAYLCYALESGLRVLLQIEGVAPSFLLILAVYVGLLAQPRTVMWAFLVCGLLTDMLGYYTGDFIILGPTAIGFLVGGYATLLLRGLVFRESIVTLSIMSFSAGLFINLVTLFILKLRGLGILTGESLDLSVVDAFVQAFLQLLYTAVAAVPVGFILLRTARAWHFPGKARMDRHY